MVKLHIYVEGGARQQKDLNIKCRQGFSTFVAKSGIESSKTQFIPKFDRGHAFNAFRKALKINSSVLLLIDSERPIRDTHTCDAEGKGGLPWEHLKLRTGDAHWEKPDNAKQEHCHFMVECMENWFLADKDAVKRYFGNDFKENLLPGNSNIESIQKQTVLTSLKTASMNCKKRGCYDKGDHSFTILAEIDAEKVIAASPWARRFINTLKEQLAG